MSEVEQKSEVGEVETLELGEFSQLLKENFRPRNAEAESEVEKAVGTLVAQALEDSNLIKDDVLDTIDEMIARLDEKLSEQVTAIMHADEFQQLEGAWRGLAYLVNNSETDSTLKVRVMNVTKNELYRDLRRYTGTKWDQSPLFKTIYEGEFGTLGGKPYGCLVGDYYFDHSSTDVSILRDMAKIAAAAHCPFISGASSSLTGMDSWAQLNNPRDLGNIFEAPDYAGWRSLRDSENARYVGLAMPRVLSREPYGAKTVPIEEFNYEEAVNGKAGHDYAWMNAAYAMATNINRAYKEHGWTTRIRGVQSGGEVMNLPVHTFDTDDGGVDMKCPTEVSINDRREAELSKAGLLPLCHRKSTDKAAFLGAQSIYKPKKYDDADATASDNLSSRIPYMFAVSRFSHYLKCMVRDKVGENMEEEELQRWLQKWITQYVDGDPKNSSIATKAKKPLAAANVDVFPDEENPGYYGARFYLRPHFQLEGMNVGMSLVSRLPKK